MQAAAAFEFCAVFVLARCGLSAPLVSRGYSSRWRMQPALPAGMTLDIRLFALRHLVKDRCCLLAV